MPAPSEAYVAALRTLADAGVEFLVVGVNGINFYARDAGVAFETRDLDVWLRPTAKKASKFSLQGAALRVAPLETLLESKRLAGREKDVRFLEAFAARRDEFLSPDASSPLPRRKKTKK